MKSEQNSQISDQVFIYHSAISEQNYYMKGSQFSQSQSQIYRQNSSIRQTNSICFNKKFLKGLAVDNIQNQINQKQQNNQPFNTNFIQQKNNPYEIRSQNQKKNIYISEQSSINQDIILSQQQKKQNTNSLFINKQNLQKKILKEDDVNEQIKDRIFKIFTSNDNSFSNFKSQQFVQDGIKQQHSINISQTNLMTTTNRDSMQTINQNIPETNKTIENNNFGFINKISDKFVNYINNLQKANVKRAVKIQQFFIYQKQFYGSPNNYFKWLKNNFFNNQIPMALKKDFQRKHLTLLNLYQSINSNNKYLKQFKFPFNNSLAQITYFCFPQQIIKLIDQNKARDCIRAECITKYQQTNWMNQFIQSFSKDFYNFFQFQLQLKQTTKMLCEKIFKQYQPNKDLIKFNFYQFIKVKDITTIDFKIILQKQQFKCIVINYKRLQKTLQLFIHNIDNNYNTIISQQFGQAFFEYYQKNKINIKSSIQEINLKTLEQVAIYINSCMGQIGFFNAVKKIHFKENIEWQQNYQLKPIKIKHFSEIKQKIKKSFNNFFIKSQVLQFIKIGKAQQNRIIIIQEVKNKSYIKNQLIQKEILGWPYEDCLNNLSFEKRKGILKALYYFAISNLIITIGNQILLLSPHIQQSQLVLNIVAQKLKEFRQELQQIELRPSTQMTIRTYQFSKDLFSFLC